MSESDADVVHEDTGVTVKLTERDIPGALLNEPFEIHTIPELKWWLLCRGIQAASTWKKPKIISRYTCLLFILMYPLSSVFTTL